MVERAPAETGSRLTAESLRVSSADAASIPRAEDELSIRGRITWHSSEEDGGPDVGRSLGLGDGRILWFGEISSACYEEAGEEAAALGGVGGTWIILYDKNEARVIGKAVDDDVGEDVLTALASVMSRPTCVSDGSREAGETAGLAPTGDSAEPRGERT